MEKWIGILYFQCGLLHPTYMYIYVHIHKHKQMYNNYLKKIIHPENAKSESAERVHNVSRVVMTTCYPERSSRQLGNQEGRATGTEAILKHTATGKCNYRHRETVA